MNFDKLKESARKYEQGGDWRRAIEVYQKAIQEFEAGNDPAADLSIYNRVGDLYLKANDPAGAVQAYEKAADLYREQGFYNNAIALCGKILRVNPGRSRTYLTLAYLHAHKNVVIEAKKNLLEYLDRMNATNQLDEAFKVMKEFADHFPGNKDLRLMLSDLLRASSRDEEAREQLEKLASDLEARGDAVGARRTLQKLHAMDLSEGPTGVKAPTKGDLVFLDTGYETPSGRAAAATPRRRTTVRLPATGLPPAEPVEADAEPLEIEGSALTTEAIALEPALPLSDEASLEMTSLDVGLTLGFEPTSSEGETAADVSRVDGLEVDPSAGAETDVDRVEGLETGLGGAEEELGVEYSPSEVDGGEPLLDVEPTSLAVDLEPLEVVSPEDDLSDELDEALAGMPSVAAESAGNDLGLDLIDSELTAVEDEPAEVSEFEVDELLDVNATVEAAAVQTTLADLEGRVFDDPDNPEHHRALGEALLASGDAERGLEELDLALSSYEAQEDWERATDMVGELTRLEPSAVRHYQKRVELAYRVGDRGRLIGAYLELGDALMRAGAVDKALAVYSRVAEHDPENQRARSALETLAPLEEVLEAPAPVATVPVTPTVPIAFPPVAPPALPPTMRMSTAEPIAQVEQPALPRRASSVESVPAAATDFIDLGALIMDEEKPRDLRMKSESEQKTGDEQKDFRDMLVAFKRGIDENIDAEDFQAHYDMGVAFKEMGLLDEAIAEFQKALRSPEGRLRTSEALGVAFYEKGQFAIAEAILKRAVETLGASDDEQIGLIYWLARSTEAQQKNPASITWYERVMAVDIGFMDASARMQQLAGRTA